MSYDPQECLAFSLIKGMNARAALEIVDNLGDLHEFFRLDVKDAKKLPNAGDLLIEVLKERKTALAKAKEELRYIKKNNIQVHCIFDKDNYPYRLEQCADAPVCFFSLGNCNLDDERMLAVVGTRRCTAYGQSYTGQIIEEIREGVGSATIVSGLAYGIDKAAHEAALRLGMPTVGVLAHGLSMIYPAQHRGLAASIVRKGGMLITEYLHAAQPFRNHFLERNRIIAGLCDAVFVAESPLRGGALNTAAHARNYDREVLALPGRATDEASAGCNSLISRQLAVLATSAKDVAIGAGWKYSNEKADPLPQQESLFDVYSGNTKVIYDYLRSQTDPVTVHKMVKTTGLSTKEVMSSIGELDMDGILKRHPGAKYFL